MKKSGILLFFCLLVLNACSQNTTQESEIEGSIRMTKEEIEIMESEGLVGSSEDENSEIEETEDEDLEIEENSEENDEDSDSESEETDQDEVVVDYDGENYIQINSPSSEETFFEGPIQFIGEVSPNVEKITVKASGFIEESGNMIEFDDVYTLQNFQYGDTTLSYSADFEFNNLFVGTNEFTFTAFFDDGTEESVDLTLYFLNQEDGI